MYGIGCYPSQFSGVGLETLLKDSIGFTRCGAGPTILFLPTSSSWCLYEHLGKVLEYFLLYLHASKSGMIKMGEMLEYGSIN